MVSQRKNIALRGTATKQIRRLDEKTKEDDAALEERSRSRRSWKEQEERVIGSVHSNMQVPPRPRHTCWGKDIVLRVRDGTWPLTKKSRKQCHPVGEAAEISWDVVPVIEVEASSSIHPLKPNL